MKFSKEESKLVLEAIALVLGVRNKMSNLDAIKYCIDTSESNSKTQKILVAIKKDIESGDLPSDAFEKYDLLSEVEATKYKSYKDDRHIVINKIIEERKHVDRFEPPFSKLFRRLAFVFIVSSVGLYFAQGWLIDNMSDYLRSEGVRNPIEEIPFFIKNVEFNFVLVGLFFVLSFGTNRLYKHYYNNDRKVVYKYFPVKQYDDLPDMFDTMHNYHKGIKETNKVFLKMSILKPYRGLRNMFLELDEATRDIDSTYYDIFGKYNFSKKITEFIAIIDDKDILKNFSDASKLAKDVGNKEFEKFLAKVDAIAEYVPYTLFALIFGTIAYYMGALDYSMDIGALTSTNIGGIR